VGGYASGPVLRKAASRGIPTLIQEQNSYAGVTNRLLAKRAKKICVAYEGMEKYFPADKLVLTGNPVRQEIRKLSGKITTEARMAARTSFGFSKNDRILLVLGGSLGARTINESVKAGLERFRGKELKLIWQCGKYYYESLKPLVSDIPQQEVLLKDFIQEMDQAYLAADLIISRAGALSISELCIVGRPAVLVPSPNVAEDHQTKNASALVNAGAALMVADADAPGSLANTVLELLEDEKKQAELSKNIRGLAKPGSTEKIASEVIGIINEA
jgi:UDP-N-acetylglucosamine--N-acetylmuramyl-(pentapeptide) pyrophosphoryl-undecaprenol N-acetylglucosamine transferase